MRTAMALLRTLALGLFVAVVSTAGGPAAAHPHVWIDMRTVTELDADGKVQAVRIEWLFDPFYSAFAQEDLDTDGDGAVTDAEADAWAQEALSNIARADYFAEFLVDGLSTVPKRADRAVGRWTDGRLFMSFAVYLDTPADPRSVAVGHLVYDPSFYIDISHPDGDGMATVEGPGAEGCVAEVGRADPSPETVASAAALDRDQSGPPDLGRLFADYVRVSCQ
jgi:ABC-type uncharacterized transport system substrate-binding protein